MQDNDGATGGTTSPVVDADLTLRKLTDAIVAAGGPSYSSEQINPVDDQEGGEPGGNIRVAFLVQDGTPLSFVTRDRGDSTTDTNVTTLDGAAALTHSPGRVSPASDAWVSTRVPLAGEFTFGGQKVFVVANHWSSKGGDQPLFGHLQPPTQASEAKRVQQAQVVNDFVDEFYAVDPEANVVVLGDLNDLEYSDSVTTLTDDGSALLDLPGTLPDPERYTYVFDGNSQVLDHIALSPGLERQGFDYDVVHVNAEYANQASDHDPQVVSLDLGLAPATLTATAIPVQVVYRDTSAVTGTLTDQGGRPIGDATVALESRPLGDQDWSSTQRTATTGSADSSYTFSVSPAATTDYRVVFDGNQTYSPATSTRVTVEVATHVSLSVEKTVLKRGESTQFAGVVAPNHAGQDVRVQRLADGGWLTLDTVTLDQDSFYSYQLKTTKRSSRGTTAYRIAKPADTDHVGGSSRQVDITIR